MKSYGLTAFLGFVMILNGCGATHLMVKSNSSRHMKNPQMNDFLGTGDIVQTASGLRVTLQSDDIFESGQTTLSVYGLQRVDAIAAVILKYPEDFLAINGYTDTDADYTINVRFSEYEVNAIKAELIKRGVSLSSVTAVGKGSAQPIAVNDSDEDKAKNRRIEFEITTRE